MKTMYSTMLLTGLLAVSPLTLAADKDCLIEGTVRHMDRGGQAVTTVQIDSVGKYEETSNCRVRRGEKMEFKLPADSRVKDAPDGSEVKYRYRSNDNGSDAQLISIDA